MSVLELCVLLPLGELVLSLWGPLVGLPVARCLARTFWGDILIRSVHEAGEAGGPPSGTETTLRLDSVDRSFQLVA